MISAVHPKTSDITLMIVNTQTYLNCIIDTESTGNETVWIKEVLPFAQYPQPVFSPFSQAEQSSASYLT